jgi:hypothetical protein
MHTVAKAEPVVEVNGSSFEVIMPVSSSGISRGNLADLVGGNIGPDTRLTAVVINGIKAGVPDLVHLGVSINYTTGVMNALLVDRDITALVFRGKKKE